MMETNFTYEMFDESVKNIARTLLDYPRIQKEAVIVTIPRGGLILAATLSYKLDRETTGKTHKRTEQSRYPVYSINDNVLWTMPIDTNIILVDDIYDTGQTMDAAFERLRHIGFIHIYGATLCTYKNRKPAIPKFFTAVQLPIDTDWIRFWWENV